MDARGGKIIDFLRENSHLDLEVPDIAFNVKKSERTVEAALKKFQQKGLVTARQNEYGRVYWYALPSAPATKTFKVEDIASSKKELAASSADGSENEVDLSDLTGANSGTEGKGNDTGKPAPSSGKKKPPAKKTPARKKAAGKKTAVKKEAVSAESKETSEEKQEKVSSGGFFASGSEKTDQPVEQVSGTEEEAFDLESLSEEAPTIDSFRNGGKDSTRVMPKATFFSSSLVSPLLVAVLVIGCISIIALAKSFGSTGKIEAVRAEIPTDVVATGELQEVKEQLVKIDKLESSMAAMSVEIDSLKKEVEKLVETPKKKTVKRRRKRR